MKLNKIKMVGTSLALSAALLAGVANAGSINIQGADVLRVGCAAKTVGCFAVIGEAVGPAGCTSALISFNGTTSSGKNALATLMTIKAAGFKANLTIDDTICNGPNPSLIAVTMN